MTEVIGITYIIYLATKYACLINIYIYIYIYSYTKGTKPYD